MTVSDRHEPSFTADNLCSGCGDAMDPLDGHLVECWGTIGELFCRECWDENLEAAAAYDLEDSR